MATAKDNSKKTMDVSKPGESAPDSSSRPVIVTHRPMMQDPMMKENASTEPESTSAAPAKVETTHEDKVIQPMSGQTSLSESTELTETVESVETDESSKNTVASTKPEATETTENTESTTAPNTTSKESTTTKPEEPSSSATTSEQSDSKQKQEAEAAATVDAIADQVELKSKKKNNQPTAEEIAKQEAIKKLIEDKKYFVEIGHVAHRRARNTAVTTVFLLIALVSFYLAIDSGLINLDIQLPLDLIPN